MSGTEAQRGSERSCAVNLSASLGYARSPHDRPKPAAGGATWVCIEALHHHHLRRIATITNQAWEHSVGCGGISRPGRCLPSSPTEDPLHGDEGPFQENGDGDTDTFSDRS
jgi:hypothetical protein